MPIGFGIAAVLVFAGGHTLLDALRLAYVEGRTWYPALYASPGSYEAAKALIALSQSRLIQWHGRGVGVAQVAVGGTDRNSAPQVVVSPDGTVAASTGAIARLVVELVRRIPTLSVPGRVSLPHYVTVVRLNNEPGTREHLCLKVHVPIYVPVAISFATAVVCAAIGDWRVLVAIIIGIGVNGFASCCLRVGDLAFSRGPFRIPTPVGDGYLDAGDELVVFKGPADAIGAVLWGGLSIRFDDDAFRENLTTAGALYTSQCLIDLALVPFGTTTGQVFFTLCMLSAWAFNAYVGAQASTAWMRMVREDVLKGPDITRYRFGSRTAAVVFLMKSIRPRNVESQLSRLLPKDTRVWNVWRRLMVEVLRDGIPNIDDLLVYRHAAAAGLNEEETACLETLVDDARIALGHTE